MYDLEASNLMRAMWAARDKYGPDDPVNIFYLDHNPTEAARAHANTHVVKMILETAQLLSTAWHVASPDLVESGWDNPARDIVPEGEIPWLHYSVAGQRIYRATHQNHPCAVWVRESTGNYRWLHRLGMALLEEYTYRYGRQHAAAPVMWTLEVCPPGIPEGPQSEPPSAMPDELQVVDAEGYVDAVASYRNYYVTAKQPLLKWGPRGSPYWIRADGGQFTLAATESGP